MANLILSDEVRYRVVLPSEIAEQMYELCKRDRTSETGGVLVGTYSSDLMSAFVHEATPAPPDSSSGPNWFHRGTIGLKEMLRTRWGDSPRSHYVGEWHFHPSNVPQPSAADLRQLRTVAQSQNYQCEQPILLIVYRTEPDKFSISGRLLDHFGRLLEVAPTITRSRTDSLG